MRIRAWGVLCLVVGLVIGAAPGAWAGSTYGVNGPTNVTTNRQTIARSAELAVGIINDRISQATSGIGFGTSATSGANVSLGPGGGKAAGSVPAGVGLWSSLGHDWIRDTTAGASFSGTILAGVAGIDYRWQPWLLVGAAAGYEGIDLRTAFNSGTQSSNGGVVSGYAAARLSPNYSVSGEFGHGWINYRENHGGISGNFSGDRWFAATDFNAATAIDNWQLGGSVGYFFVSESQSAYRESNGNAVASVTPYLGQFRIKPEVGYRFTLPWGTLTPFVSARLEFDANHSQAPIINSAGQRAPFSSFGTTFASGVRTTLGDGVSFTLEGTTSQFRRHFSSYGILGSLRFQF